MGYSARGFDETEMDVLQGDFAQGVPVLLMQALYECLVAAGVIEGADLAEGEFVWRDSTHAPCRMHWTFDGVNFAMQLRAE